MDIKQTLTKFMQSVLPSKVTEAQMTALNAYKDGRLSDQEMLTIVQGFGNVTINVQKAELQISNWGVLASPNGIQSKQ